MIHRSSLLRATALTGVLLTGVARAASATPADQAKPAAATPLTELVVTANRRDQKILDVPYNITAVSGKTIDENQVQNAAELLRSVAGVSLVDRGPRNQGTATNIQMRGVNVDSAARYSSTAAFSRMSISASSRTMSSVVC